MPIAIDRTKATESKGQSRRNRSNTESDFVLPCYSHNLVSVDWLYCVQVSRPKFGSVTIPYKPFSSETKQDPVGPSLVQILSMSPISCL